MGAALHTESSIIALLQAAAPPALLAFNPHSCLEFKAPASKGPGSSLSLSCTNSQHDHMRLAILQSSECSRLQ